MFFTTIPQNLWSTLHFSVGQDTKYRSVYKYIIWHKPDFSMFKIYDGEISDGITVIPHFLTTRGNNLLIKF